MDPVAVLSNFLPNFDSDPDHFCVVMLFQKSQQIISGCTVTIEREVEAFMLHPGTFIVVITHLLLKID